MRKLFLELLKEIEHLVETDPTFVDFLNGILVAGPCVL